MDQRNNEGDLQNEDHGNAHHEGDVLGLVADELHGDEHGQRTAQSREDEQSLLGDAEADVIFLGDLLVVDADDDGDQGDHQNVGGEDQPGQRNVERI